jgi:hypothetical protein
VQEDHRSALVEFGEHRLEHRVVELASGHAGAEGDPHDRRAVGDPGEFGQRFADVRQRQGSESLKASRVRLAQSFSRDRGGQPARPEPPG